MQHKKKNSMIGMEIVSENQPMCLSSNVHPMFYMEDKFQLPPLTALI